jgi:hypothetical protein
VTGSFVPQDTQNEQCVSIKTHDSTPDHARAVLNIAGVQLRTTGNKVSYELTNREHETGLGADGKATVYFKTARSAGSRITRINFEFAIINKSEDRFVFAPKTTVDAIDGKVTALDERLGRAETTLSTINGNYAKKDEVVPRGKPIAIAQERDPSGRCMHVSDPAGESTVILHAGCQGFSADQGWRWLIQVP